MPATLNELDALTILSGTPLVGPVKIRLLIDRYGSALAALDAPPHEVASLPGFGPKLMECWGQWRYDDAWKRNLELVHKYGVSLVAYNDARFPPLLHGIPDAPVLLYVRGTLKPCDNESVAIIGTRTATHYGLEMAEKFGGDLARNGMTVVSGLARGIDTAAHRGALKHGRTIAVIGSGLADIYPRENRALAEAITANGALISEFPMLAPPDRANFPQRNRIVSGMSKGALLIEAPQQSGAMLTMRLAQRHKRRLFALPGRIDTDTMRGNLMLIKTGEAQLVEKAEEILTAFDDLFSTRPKAAPAEKKKVIVLDENELQLLKQMPDTEVTIETMISLTKLPVNKLSVLLMGLLLKQAIKEYPGKLYKKSLS